MMIHQKNFDGEDVMKKIKRKPIKIQFILWRWRWDEEKEEEIHQDLIYFLK
jgi:hypothetical protein